jgi:LPXTG-motif cell wall-anchored protein
MQIKLFKNLLLIMLIMQLIISGVVVTPNKIEAAEEDTITQFLSDWDWVSAQVGYSDPQKDQGMDGKPIELRSDLEGGTKVYEKGIAAHASSTIIYNIEDKGVKRFQSDLGVDFPKKRGSVTFIVSADDEVLFTSDVIRQTDPYQTIDIEIPADTKTLTLQTTTGGDSKTDDHSVWADAKLVLDAKTQENLHRISLSANKDLLSINEQAEINVEGTLVNESKVELTSDNATFTYSSSDSEIAEVNGQGIVTAKKSGSVEITLEATYEGITKSASLSVLVRGGDEESEESSWIVSSPDESVKTFFTLTDGEVTFSSFKDGKEVIGDSPTGLVTNLGDFTKGLTFSTKTEESIHDSYDLLGAKQTHVEVDANETTFTFQKDDVSFQIIARAYNDGFAIRYGIESQDGETLTISSENTSFQLPEHTVSQAMTYIDHHEAVAYETKISDLNGNYAMPFLFETPNGTWGLISEAALSTDYSGAVLKGNSNGLLDVNFSPEQHGDISTSAPFVSPWRFVVIGSPADINENTMAENLSPPAAIEDTSWIKPGVSSWTWLNRESTSDLETYKRYVDLSAEMGWDYLLLDDGWQPNPPTEYYDWTEELIDYANEKKVGLLVWADKKYLDTPEEQEIIEEWADMGFKGIKADFFDSQSQDTMVLYDQLMRKTAEHQMLFNAHGSNKPTGERRTWPHSLTREGVFGAEQDLFRIGQVSARNNAMLPYTRNAVGPADYTPMLSFRNKGDRTPFSLAHMAALPIIYESGIQVLADRDNVYRSTPANSLLKNLPVSWDETQLIDGHPGEYVNISRKHGDDWYVGMITVAERDVELSLDFLDEGTYYAFIYKDGETLHDIDVELKEVTNNDKLDIPLLETGGASVKFTKTLPTQPESIILDKSELTLEQHEKVTIEATLSPTDAELDQVTWTSSNEEVATVEDGEITGLKAGRTTITASLAFDDRVAVTAEVFVLPSYTVSDNWKIIRSDVEKYKPNTPTSLTITTQEGEYYRNRATAKNVFHTNANAEDFSISTKLDFIPQGDYQSAGLQIYLNEQSMFGLYRRSHSHFHNGKILATVGLDNNSFSEETYQDPNPNQPVYLKLTKEGSTLSAFYSFNNTNWTKLWDKTNDALGAATADQIKVGLYAVNGHGKSGAIPATFEDFTLYTRDDTEGSIIAFADQDPTVNTGEASNITYNSAVLNGSIDLSETVVEKGFIWKEVNNPYQTLEVTDNNFLSELTGLSPDTNYVYRAYMETENGDIIYGEASTFTTELDDFEPNPDPIDVTEIEDLVETAKAISNEDGSYTESSYQALQEAIATAEAALESIETEEVLNAAVTALQGAIDGLESTGPDLDPVDVTELEDLVETAKAISNEDGSYTENSYQALQEAIATAEAALESIETEEVLNAAVTALQGAIDGLESTGPDLDPVDVTELEDLVETAKAISNEDGSYTKNSYQALQEAIATAEAALESIETEEALNAAVTALQGAIDELEAIEPDPEPELDPLDEVINNLKDGETLEVDLEADNAGSDFNLNADQVKKLKDKKAIILLKKNGVNLLIPASNFDGDQEIRITVERYEDNEDALSLVYDFTITQGETILDSFDKPITITFDVDESKVTDPDNIEIYYYDESNEEWVSIGGKYEGGQVTAETDHFTVFTTFDLSEGEETPSPEAPSEEEPNQNKSSDEHELPDTATSMYNFLMIGLVLFLCGAGVFFYTRKRKLKA